jgi:hypothetical protein
LLEQIVSLRHVPWWHYRAIWVDAEGTEGKTLRAVTYIARGNEFDGRPSLRYINLMREGARTWPAGEISPPFGAG